MRLRRTTPRRTSWIGWLFARWRWPSRYAYAGPALSGALVLYLAGLVVAWAGHFVVDYLRAWQLGLLALATAWVLAFGAWSTWTFKRLAAWIAPAFRSGGDPGYRAFARAWRNRIFNPWWPLAGGAILFLVAVDRIWRHDHWLTFLPHSWCDRARTPAHPVHAPPPCTADVRDERVVVTLYFAVGAPLLATMLWGFLLYTWFAARVLRRPLAVTPYLARTYLRPITSFGLRVGLGWSVATALAAGFFAHDIDGLIAILLAALALMGVALIVYPQLAAHHALTRTRDRLMARAAALLHAPDADAWVDTYVRRRDEESDRLRIFLGDMHAAPVWIYSPVEGLTFLAEVLLPIATFVITRGRS